MAYSATEYLKIRTCESSQFCVCLCFGVHRTARITLWETATGCSGGREKKDLSIILDALPYKCELKTLWASFCLWGICSTGAETVFRGIWKSALPKVVLEWTYIIQIPTFAVSEVNSIVESQSSGSTEQPPILYPTLLGIPLYKFEITVARNKETDNDMYAASLVFVFFAILKWPKNYFYFFFFLWLPLLYVNCLCRQKFWLSGHCAQGAKREGAMATQWDLSSQSRMTEGCMLACLVSGFETITMIVLTYSLSRAR